MKEEIEARLLEVDVNDFISKLQTNNAKFNGDFLQLRYCYDFKPIKENSWIRLRTNGKTTTLTIKEIVSKKIDGTKECEIEVSDFATTDELLNKLGYTARSKQENRRIQYILDGVEIDIDMWPQIPTYVEFEANSEKAIKDVCKKLGINYNSLVTLDVTSIYEKYGIDISKINILELEENRKPKQNQSNKTIKTN
ncbi:MAG: CYTH domain-containing protein [Clostridia bacterium]|nr:CYTH domain-containing protein [Clostridia bacterium]